MVQRLVCVFLIALVAVGLLSACGTGGGSSGGSDGQVCTTCYCPGFCGTLYKCSIFGCNNNFCCCYGGSCDACGCF